MQSGFWPIAGLALICAGAATATPYDGLYRLGPDTDCTRIGGEGGALRVGEGLFEGIDSQCRMTRPVDVVDMEATLYTMECAAGETSWSERALLMTAAEDGGLIMLWNGYAFRYERCDAEGAQEPFTEIEAGRSESDGGDGGLPPPRVVLPRVVLPTEGEATEETTAIAEPQATAPETGAPADAEAEPETDAPVDAEDETGAPADAEADAETDADAEPETGAPADVEADTEAGASAEGDAAAEAR